jgi:chaperonin GroEL
MRRLDHSAIFILIGGTYTPMALTLPGSAKVVRTAIQNAASVSGLMLTTETLIAEKPKKEAASAGRDHHGHDHD